MDGRQRKPRKTLEERIAERKAAREARTVKIPAFYADNDTRRARLKFIREKLGKTQEAFAADMGLSFRYYQHVELGYPDAQTTMAHIRLAETFLQAYRQKKNRERVREERARERALKTAGLPVEQEQAPIPDNPQLQARAISLFVCGTPSAQIAQMLALRPEIVEHWISGIKIDEGTGE